jgi:pimeloyl-ACP methyl ester carboxylesterase
MTLAGISTSLLVGGEGPPLILLHEPGEFAGKWLRVIPELVTGFHVIAPDLPAHGASAVPAGQPTAAALMDWLDALIEHTCSGLPILVGHVLGGAIAARYAVGRSERIRTLVLVDTLGLASFRPALRFAAGLIRFQIRPSERNYDRFMRQCSYDLDRLKREMGPRWEPFQSYNLEMANSRRRGWWAGCSGPWGSGRSLRPTSAGSGSRRRSSGDGRTGPPGCGLRSGPAPGMAGRCT